MGKIKQKLVTRTAKGLEEKGIKFSEDFSYNKKILGNTFPSKKIRNQTAGYLAKTSRQEKEKQAEIDASIAKTKKE
jgi:ribosomal protein S17E